MKQGFRGKKKANGTILVRGMYSSYSIVHKAKLHTIMYATGMHQVCTEWGMYKDTMAQEILEVAFTHNSIPRAFYGLLLYVHTLVFFLFIFIFIFHCSHTQQGMAGLYIRTSGYTWTQRPTR